MESRIKSAAKTRSHIMLYGPSKQGKSWLVAKHFPNHVRHGCASTSTALAVLHSFLAKAGEPTSVQTSKETEFHASAQVVGSLSREGEHATFIPSDEVSSIASRLRDLYPDKYLLIENFHFMPARERAVFSSVLKELHDQTIPVILVGVSKHEDDLVSTTMDLSGRLQHFAVDDWTDEDLREIGRRGGLALGIKIERTVLDKMIKMSARNVGLFQLMLMYYCEENEITETRPGTLPIVLSSESSLRRAIANIYIEVVGQSSQVLSRLATHDPAYKTLVLAIAKLLVVQVSSSVDSASHDLVHFGLALTAICTTAHELVPSISKEAFWSQLGEFNRYQSEVLNSPAMYVDSRSSRLFFLDHSILSASEMSHYLAKDFLLESNLSYSLEEWARE